VVLVNTIKLKLPALMRIYLVVNISRVVQYKELVKKQRIEEPKPIEVNGKEWEVEILRILNKRMV